MAMLAMNTTPACVRASNLRPFSSRAVLVARPLSAPGGNQLRAKVARSAHNREHTVEVRGTMKLSKPRPRRRNKSDGTQLSLLSSGLTLPHPDKVASGGEDAFMVQISKNGGGSIGVSDGVGGWNAQGVNPAAYSRCLVHFSRVAIVQDERKRRETTSGNGVLQKMFSMLKSSVLKTVAISSRGAIAKAQARAKVPGSATMVLAKMDGSTGVLDVCNLGDAGLRVIRNGKVLKATVDQQYEFDMPYQMACQEFVDIEYNKASDGNTFKFELQEGDWVIAGSDGLFDNMFDSEIVDLQGQAAAKGAEAGDEYFAVQVVARALAERAKRYSRDKLRRVPYGVALAADSGNQTGLAKLLNPAMALGGKMDDITVVVSKCALRKPENKKAFSMAELDSEATALEVKRIAEDAIVENSLKKIEKYDFSAGTIKVTSKKKKAAK